jgi:hypothetical protein
MSDRRPPPELLDPLVVLVDPLDPEPELELLVEYFVDVLDP